MDAVAADVLISHGAYLDRAAIRRARDIAHGGR
jgi:hypothetical protein